MVFVRTVFCGLFVVVATLAFGDTGIETEEGVSSSSEEGLHGGWMRDLEQDQGQPCR